MKTKQKLLEDYDAKYTNLQRINEQIIEDDETYKNSMYHKERQVQAVSKDKYTSKNKYSETLSKMVLTRKDSTGNFLYVFRWDIFKETEAFNVSRI